MLFRFFCCSVFLLACPFADAATLVIEEGLNGYTGTSDNTIYQDRVDNTNGRHEWIYAGVTRVSSIRRGLIKFDLTAVPAGAAVQNASLTLHVDRSRPFDDTYSLHRLTASWGEGNVNSGDPGGLGALAIAGDATWNARHHNQQPWATAGGDFSATVSALTVFSTTGTSATFSSAGMAADIQAWLANPAQNYGWILRGEGNIQNARQFVSSDGAVGLRPRLTIDYTVSTRVRDWALYE